MTWVLSGNSAKFVVLRQTYLGFLHQLLMTENDARKRNS